MTNELEGITAVMLGNMKGIKMAGLTSRLQTIIQNLRVSEVQTAKSFRMLQAWTSTLANVPLMLSPVVSFAIFSLMDIRNPKSLGATKMFTTLSLLLLLTQPLFNMFAGLMELVSAYGCFERIEDFLMEKGREDHRLLMVNTEGPRKPDEAQTTQGHGEDGFELVAWRVQDTIPPVGIRTEAVSISTNPWTISRDKH
jgi:ATP-binding cassette subfamily C (CFTR/MRP) protein 1